MLRGSEAVVAGVAIGRQTYSLFFLRQLLPPRALLPLQLHTRGCTHRVVVSTPTYALLYLDASGGAVLMRVGAHLRSAVPFAPAPSAGQR
jgi:hypothetical protein